MTSRQRSGLSLYFITCRSLLNIRDDRFCEIAQPAHLGYMNEIEKQFLTEFDYRREAENMALIRKNILPVWGHKVDIPEPYLDLCT